jgi:ribosomal protein S18 acetylase RimI-like enzyme
VTPTVRQATSNDRQRIKEIIDKSFPRFYRYFSSNSVDSDKGGVLVSEESGVVVGFARLIEFNVGGDRFGCVLWLAVHPDYRCRGFASGLVGASVDWLKKRGAGTVFASAGHGNVGSISTFEGVGFRRVGFSVLRRFFGWGVFGFYVKIWFVPSEVVLMHG